MHLLTVYWNALGILAWKIDRRSLLENRKYIRQLSTHKFIRVGILPRQLFRATGGASKGVFDVRSNTEEAVPTVLT